ncbi:MAG: D-tyrosyl-tRNA(Tyr) deacylase [Omnitrophica WOR_2 bacterium GWF2_38_59]|nr:MAG: D-tyrosyl-tRNA(Tyr) deacylase [Omnitrophica WOR_2 bacterium GWF2_38_59]OGX51078.1 MAG: D-tyrosyl-tRNA(Tyr) deacylase [Omnitrophica WOR_2 bacterium RIFOXYA2_FULL_38_17]OGX56163.1 MAG: D-tyrosyl-tRNA(Tyr) deacylase [Omnitrophica WOR_2 bacterium RIFOXYC2_FULL_38_12]OGX60402.1 MAG: D-tyrosyl-tRNA(Tyr) deacylase [Omnitrophica WOR_2 bacterium RIFOXYB2_FULL_38_16]HBG60926.1 D-tyrosyl-tRNA(Tyr) deacylase [Candidatus Omnitrophota bacterium]
MKVVVQRVSSADVKVESKVVGKISKGMLVLLGVSKKDTAQDADYLVDKISQLRMFEDGQGKMNLSANDVKGEFLVVSQFTLCGNCDKGRRPSFDDAAPAEKAEELYEYFVEQLRKKDFKVETGVFAAMMEVSLVNDGPVTFIIEK